MTLTLKHPIMIKEILMGISLCILILGIIFAFPLLGVFALLFLPLPVLFYRLKLGRHASSIIMGVSFTILTFMVQGLALDMLYFGSLLMTGFFLGECIERHLSIERTMIYTALAVAATVFVLFVVYTAFQGQSMAKMASQYLDRYLGLTAQLYADMGMGPDQVNMLNSAFLTVLPGMFIISFMSTIWMNILIIKKLLRQKGITLPCIEHLNRYRAPEGLVWGVIALGLILFLPMETPRYISINCLIILMLVYFFQGIAIVSFFFQKKNSPAMLRIFCYSLIALQLYFLILVIGLGFFDNWINFRKLETAKVIKN